MSRVPSAWAGNWLGRLLLAGLLTSALAPAQAAYKVELSAPSELKELLTEHLDLFRFRERDDINNDQLNFMVATAAEQVTQLSSTEGYFSPKTTITVDRDSTPLVIRISVSAQQRTHVSQVTLDVRGAAAEHSPAQVAQVRQSWPLPVGAPFRQQDWEDGKQGGLQILQQRRYPAARIADSQARILADALQADLRVDYDSGPLFTFGAPQISGNQRYPESIIRNVNPLKVGEEYNIDRLLEYQRQILRTTYYSNAVVDIDREATDPLRAPVKVQVTEFPRQRIRGGVGFTTDTGAQVEGRYANNDLFGRAWVLDAQSRIEQERQLGSVSLSLPPYPGATMYSVNGSFERTTLEGIDLRSRRLGVRRARAADTLESAQSIEYYRDSVKQLSGAALPPDTIEPGTQQALVFGIEGTRRKVDDLVFPRQGRIISFQAGVAAQGLLSDQTFVRLYGRVRQFFPIGRRDLIVLGSELGAVISKDGNNGIPASLLFRAGGADSVRGYAFQSIGNERDGTVYPTRFLATGSAEYQHWFSQQWGAAVFYDVGTATDNWRDKTLYHAVGVGARWRSPVGRINADLGYGLRDNKIRPHISLGTTF